MTGLPADRPEGRRMKPRLIVYRTAEKPPVWVWNRYGTRTIGAAVRVARRHCLSLQWRRP